MTISSILIIKRIFCIHLNFKKTVVMFIKFILSFSSVLESSQFYFSSNKNTTINWVTFSFQ